ncbi:MAG: hypothetical protein K2N11_02550 [Mucispirillum sp.]|nr:hypothetical protein [Mucispirillum sp.]
MKNIIFIFTFLLIALPVFAVKDGEKIDGVNYCNKVNRYDVSKVTSISFPDTTLYGSGSSYTYRTIVVGYQSVPFLNATFNGKTIGHSSMEPFECPKNYANGASGSFYAGRIIEWYIPSNYVTSSNSITVTVQDKTASKSGIKVPNTYTYGLEAIEYNEIVNKEGNPCNPVEVNLKEEIRYDVERQLEIIANPVEAEIIDTGYAGYLFEDKYSCQSMPVDINDMQ